MTGSGHIFRESFGSILIHSISMSTQALGEDDLFVWLLWALVRLCWGMLGTFFWTIAAYAKPSKMDRGVEFRSVQESILYR